LVVAGASRLPDDVDPSWDLCIVASRCDEPPRTRVPRQGWVAVQDADALWTAIDVRTRAHHLARLEAEIAASPAAAVRMSVVVCTYRRAELLDACLASVAAQRFPADAYEVIVVDNDPGDPAVRTRI